MDSEYQYTGQSDPVTFEPVQEIGCALSAAGGNVDVSATVTLAWESADENGTDSWSDTQWGGISHKLTRTVPVTADDLRVQCDLEVTFSGGFNTVIQRSSIAYAPGRPPYVTVGSDTGNQWINNRWERHFWWQLWNPNSTPWTKQGQVFEAWRDSYNPCNLGVIKGIVGSVNAVGQFSDSYFYDVQAIANPSCTYHGEQRYTLSTASFQVVQIAEWRFDTSGIYRLR